MGRTLPGGLRVLDRLGSTPEGTLYHAEYPTGIEVALLILRPETGGAKPSRRERLDQATLLQHLNVAAIYEVGEMGDGSLYVVLEQLVGEPLSNLVAAGHAFALPEALDLALQAAAGLQAAHRAGFVHGSLSPDTIVVTRAVHGRAQVKLIRFTLDPALRQAGVAPPIPGEASARYASPERLAGHPPDERSDVFSLGAVLHHLLTGMPPDAGDVDSSVPEVAHAVLGTALAPVPARRFQTISEFEAALERLAALAGKPKRPRIHQALVLGAVGAGLALVAGGILLLPGSKWPAASEERPVPVAGTTDLERAVPGPPPTLEAPSAPAPARSQAPAPSAARQDALRTRNSPLDSARSPALASADPAPRATRPRSVPTAVADTETDGSIESDMVATPPPEEPPPPTMEERAQVYLRIGLDEASRQLGRPIHAVEGMAPLFLGLARSRFPAYTDTARPVVRSVYIEPNGNLILLDQQRIRPEGRVPATTATSWRIGDVMLYLHGEARSEVLRNLVRRVR
ncbi:MAG TPA: protein kinase [Gemmatimonadales bacterium]|nr:protein kinase [Gemmatimonadales bacterium]